MLRRLVLALCFLFSSLEVDESFPERAFLRLRLGLSLPVQTRWNRRSGLLFAESGKSCHARTNGSVSDSYLNPYDL